MLDVREAGGGRGGPERGVQPHPGHHPAQPRRLGARGQPGPGLRPPPAASPSDYRSLDRDRWSKLSNWLNVFCGLLLKIFLKQQLCLKHTNFFFIRIFFSARLWSSVMTKSATLSCRWEIMWCGICQERFTQSNSLKAQRTNFTSKKHQDKVVIKLHVWFVRSVTNMARFMLFQGRKCDNQSFCILLENNWVKLFSDLSHRRVMLSFKLCEDKTFHKHQHALERHPRHHHKLWLQNWSDDPQKRRQ